jgi:hypothetical protein
VHLSCTYSLDLSLPGAATREGQHQVHISHLASCNKNFHKQLHSSKHASSQPQSFVFAIAVAVLSEESRKAPGDSSVDFLRC